MLTAAASPEAPSCCKSQDTKPEFFALSALRTKGVLKEGMRSLRGKMLKHFFNTLSLAYIKVEFGFVSQGCHIIITPCVFFSSYDGEFRLPLVLAQASPIFHSSCEGKLGIALE